MANVSSAPDTPCSSMSVSPLPSSSSLVSSESSGVCSTSRNEFTIPRKWKPSIMFAISERKLCPDIRNEIVRDLVTHVYGQVDKPDTVLATKVAKLLVEKYPFMADSVTSSGSQTYVNGLCCAIVVI